MSITISSAIRCSLRNLSQSGGSAKLRTVAPRELSNFCMYVPVHGDVFARPFAVSLSWTTPSSIFHSPPVTVTSSPSLLAHRHALTREQDETWPTDIPEAWNSRRTLWEPEYSTLMWHHVHLASGFSVRLNIRAPSVRGLPTNWRRRLLEFRRAVETLLRHGHWPAKSPAFI